MHHRSISKIGLFCLMIPTLVLAGWSIQNSGTTTQLNDVDFVDANDGWVVGGAAYSQPGIILHTSDGGNNWVDQTPNIPAGIEVLEGVSFANTTTGWAVGRDTLAHALILKTTDGGQSWFRQNSPIVDLWPVAVHFVNANSGWISQGGPYGPSYRQVILYTNNGGSSYSNRGWDNYDGGTSRLYFADLLHGFVAGGTEMTPTTRGYIMRTTDGGSTWGESYHWGATVPYTYPMMTGVHFPVDNQNGWACGNLYASATYREIRIIHTYNGGSNWSIQYRVQGSAASYFLNDIHFVDLQNGWAVGGEGKILRTTDGGSNWTFETTGVSNGLRGVDFVDLNNGWAVGTNGAILKYSSPEVSEHHEPKPAKDFDFTVFPQQDGIAVLISSHEPAFAIFSLYNIAGQKTLSKRIVVPEGRSRYRFNLPQKTSSGIYFLNATISNRSVVRKFTLIR